MKKHMILTAAAALLCTLICTGCNDKEPVEPVLTDAQTTTAAETAPQAPQEVTAESVLASFAKETLGGEINIVLSNAFNATIYVQQAPGENMNGEIVNDELIRRDTLLEEYFGVELNYNVLNSNSEILPLARTALLADTGAYMI